MPSGDTEVISRFDADVAKALTWGLQLSRSPFGVAVAMQLEHGRRTLGAGWNSESFHQARLLRFDPTPFAQKASRQRQPMQLHEGDLAPVVIRGWICGGVRVQQSVETLSEELEVGVVRQPEFSGYGAMMSGAAVLGPLSTATDGGKGAEVEDVLDPDEGGRRAAVRHGETRGGIGVAVVRVHTCSNDIII